MRRNRSAPKPTRANPRRNPSGLSRATRKVVELGYRARGQYVGGKSAFVPPEDWHEPQELCDGRYRVITRPPGDGFRHVVTPAEIRQRLAELPPEMLRRLEVVQLARMTRKKLAFPCYGMQWGQTIYLYPIDESLVEYFPRPPRPAVLNEARTFGGKWVQEGTRWKLVWKEAAIHDFYLNNVLIHELGHLLDDRNSNARDRERYAEWFAIRYGYQRRGPGSGR